jgi:hypothetical protein
LHVTQRTVLGGTANKRNAATAKQKSHFKKTQTKPEGLAHTLLKKQPSR